MQELSTIESLHITLPYDEIGIEITHGNGAAEESVVFVLVRSSTANRTA